MHCLCNVAFPGMLSWPFLSHSQHLQSIAVIWVSLCSLYSTVCRIVEWLSLEGTSRSIEFQPPCCVQGCQLLYQVLDQVARLFLHHSYSLLQLLQVCRLNSKYQCYILTGVFWLSKHPDMTVHMRAICPAMLQFGLSLTVVVMVGRCLTLANICETYLMLRWESRIANRRRRSSFDCVFLVIRRLSVLL